MGRNTCFEEKPPGSRRCSLVSVDSIGLGLLNAVLSSHPTLLGSMLSTTYTRHRMSRTVPHLLLPSPSLNLLSP